MIMILGFNSDVYRNILEQTKYVTKQCSPTSFLSHLSHDSLGYAITFTGHDHRLVS